MFFQIICLLNFSNIRNRYWMLSRSAIREINPFGLENVFNFKKNLNLFKKFLTTSLLLHLAPNKIWDENSQQPALEDETRQESEKKFKIQVAKKFNINFSKKKPVKIVKIFIMESILIFYEHNACRKSTRNVKMGRIKEDVREKLKAWKSFNCTYSHRVWLMYEK